MPDLRLSLVIHSQILRIFNMIYKCFQIKVVTLIMKQSPKDSSTKGLSSKAEECEEANTQQVESQGNALGEARGLSALYFSLRFFVCDLNRFFHNVHPLQVHTAKWKSSLSLDPPETCLKLAFIFCITDVFHYAQRTLTESQTLLLHQSTSC